MRLEKGHCFGIILDLTQLPPSSCGIVIELYLFILLLCTLPKCLQHFASIMSTIISAAFVVALTHLCCCCCCCVFCCSWVSFVAAPTVALCGTLLEGPCVIVEGASRAPYSADPLQHA